MWTSTNNTFCKIWKTAILKKICTSGGTDICRSNLSNDNQTNYFMFKVYMYILTDPNISAIIEHSPTCGDKYLQHGCLQMKHSAKCKEKLSSTWVSTNKTFYMCTPTGSCKKTSMLSNPAEQKMEDYTLSTKSAHLE